jgi:hypothetical protein
LLGDSFGGSSAKLLKRLGTMLGAQVSSGGVGASVWHFNQLAIAAELVEEIGMSHGRTLFRNVNTAILAAARSPANFRLCSTGIVRF